MDRSLEITQCPVCGSRVFADMEICFECMHPLMIGFSSQGDIEAEVGAETSLSQDLIIGGLDGIPSPGAISIGIEASGAMSFDDVKMPDQAEKQDVESSVSESRDTLGKENGSKSNKEALFCEFLKEFERFLGQFVIDRQIDVK